MNNESILTERGQASLPAAIRKEMGLRTGQRLRWEKISDREIRVTLKSDKTGDPMAALGYFQKLGRPKRRTDEYMKEMREGDH